MDTNREVRIENLCSWVRSLKLNSGVVLHIPPRATSQAIAGIEVQNNAEVEKLKQRCSIVIHGIDLSSSPSHFILNEQ